MQQTNKTKKVCLPRNRLVFDKLVDASVKGNAVGIENLLDHYSLNINQSGPSGKTLLYHAIISQKAEAVLTLLKYGADPNICSFVTHHRDGNGGQLISCDEPPLLTAARYDNAIIAKYLLHCGADPDSQSQCHGHRGECKIRDKTALHWACEHCDRALVKVLLDNKALVNICDRQKELPIHIASRCKRCDQQHDIVRMLCQAGADVKAINKIGCTPLYLAAFYGCNVLVEMLLCSNADVNYLCERESSYGTPLHIAAIKDRLPLAELLVSYGARLNIENALGYTPLHLNINGHSKSNIAQLLIYHGSDMNGIDKYNNTLLSTCITAIRLDCESLAKVMVHAGYDLSQDRWLKANWTGDQEAACPVPIPEGRVRKLCDWLLEQQQLPRHLSMLCRNVIRKAVSRGTYGRSVVPPLQSLPLPKSLKDFLLLHDVIGIPNT